jgi:hypothetical protein
MQSDLLQVVQPFGTVAKLVMLRAKNQVPSSVSLVSVARWICDIVICDMESLLQALVQMEDLASSVSAIQYYTTIQPSVRYILSRIFLFAFIRASACRPCRAIFCQMFLCVLIIGNSGRVVPFSF